MCRPGPNPNRKKLIALWLVGILTTIYVVAELALAIWTKSLVLLSDGFHNLSDVVSIVIAYWSIVKSASGASDTMSFGWKRTEIVGALINACSLLSLCLYILLEAVPRFVHPEEILVNKYFLGIASAGIAVNLFGTIVFYFTGTHAHAHAHDEAEEIVVEEEGESHLHGHVHGHDSEKKHKKSKSHDHGAHTPAGHSINNADGEDRYVVLDENGIEVQKPKKPKKHHDHDHSGHDHDHDHGHSHDEKSHHEHKKDKKAKKKDHNHSHDHHDHSHGHDHSHDHSHSHGHDHSHSHGHDHSHGGHGHSHDMNMWAVFVHYLGDAISSVFVLITGILVYLYPTKKWSLYLDPISSLVIVGIMLYSTIPLVRQCALILLQRVPPHVNLANLRKKLLKIDHVLGAHDLHVWCLVDGMTICTVHLALDSPDHFESATKAVRKLFHRFGIHSSTIQPEFPLAKLPVEPNSTELQSLASRSTQLTANCEQNCLPNCTEDWCCKTVTPAKPTTHGALDFDPVFNPREPDPPRLNPPPGDRLDLV
jgi:zinc transporter 1